MFFLLCVILFTSDRVISCFYKKYAVLTDPLLVCSWISLARKIKTLHACLYSTLFDFTKKYISGVLPVALNLISSWRDGDSFTGLGWQNTFAGRNFRGQKFSRDRKVVKFRGFKFRNFTFWRKFREKTFVVFCECYLSSNNFLGKFHFSRN